jgi:nicotinamide-nucleotide amidase
MLHRDGERGHAPAMHKPMKKIDAEVLTIGDELNRGEIVDTNSSWLAEQLTELGLHVRWRTSVTDDAPDMTAALERALARADVVVCSGGLGPTDDDRTVDTVCALLGTEPIEEPIHAERMRVRFAERNFRLTPNNLRQVRVPRGAEVLANPTGIAPGFTVRPAGRKGTLSCMPGVPREMRPMFEAGLRPALAARVGEALQSVRRTFRMAGIGESHVDHALRGLLDPAGAGGAGPGHDTTLHFRIAFPENLVTLVVRRPVLADAVAELERLTSDVEARLGEHIYGRDGDTLPIVIGRALAARGETLALAESCTGGLVGALVTEAPGASRYFLGGVVSYADALKRDLLGVPAGLLAEHGAVSEPVARAMAEGARTRLGASWAISLTGIAGPDGGTADKPVGTVWIGVAGPGDAGTQARKIFWPGEREMVRRMAAISSLHLLYKALRPR